ncbi:MAG: hypothetical protein GX116_07095 [Fibrobacter sp.]|nr:hypothetical protein [Fibrobacter sp.]
METDSTHTIDSQAVDTPFVSINEVGVNIKLFETPTQVLLGDTFDIKVLVSWQGEASLLLLPLNSVNSKGLEQISVKQESGRLLQNSKIHSENTFTYKIVALDTGEWQVPSLKILSPISQNKNLELETEPFTMRVETPFQFLPLISSVLFLMVFFAFIYWKQKKRRQKQEQIKSERSFEENHKEAFLILKQRVNTADSREWLLALEKNCAGWAQHSLKIDSLELLVDQNPEWNLLLEEFKHARYGGGFRDSFMNLETWKLAAKLMSFSEDE